MLRLFDCQKRELISVQTVKVYLSAKQRSGTKEKKEGTFVFKVEDGKFIPIESQTTVDNHDGKETGPALQLIVHPLRKPERIPEEEEGWDMLDDVGDGFG